MADTGEQPPLFWTKLLPEGPKKSFFKAGSPSSQGLDDRSPPPPLSEGLDPPLRKWVAVVLLIV